MLKRYLVFAGGSFFPGTAMEDFREDFDVEEDARHFAHCLRNERTGPTDVSPFKYDWVETYDQETRAYLYYDHG